MITLAAVSMIDIFFVGRFGLEALAGVSITFPMMMLMQTMAAGGMGGGVAAAVARARGAGKQDEVDRVAGQALVVAIGMAGLFIAMFVGFARPLYGAIGATGAELDAAVTYSNVLFLGGAIMWVFHLLSAVVRGTGEHDLPGRAARPHPAHPSRPVLVAISFVIFGVVIAAATWLGKVV